MYNTQLLSGAQPQIVLGSGTSAADIVIRQRQITGISCSRPAPQWDYISPTPALEAKGLTTGKLREIIGNINDQSERDVNDNFNPLYSKLVFLPIIGVFLGFIICASSMGSMGNSDSFGPPTGFFVGMALFGLSGFGQVITCCLVGKAHLNAVQIAIDTMREYVEITLNEQWQKECGVRWTVTTQQTLSVSTHHHHENHHGHHHGHHHGNHQRIRVQTWYNIEVRALDQVVQQVVVPVVVPHIAPNQAPPQYVPATGVVQGNGTEGVYNAPNAPHTMTQGTQQPVYQ